MVPLMQMMRSECFALFLRKPRGAGFIRRNGVPLVGKTCSGGIGGNLFSVAYSRPMVF